MIQVDPGPWTSAAIGLAVLVAMVGLLLKRRAAAPEARGPRWRFALLLALQPGAGILLQLCLFPPDQVIRTGTLVVATGGAPAAVALEAGEVLAALPEAGSVEDAVRVPDLATALRRFSGAARIRIVGRGLTPRDQGAVPVPLSFDPPPEPRGLIDLAWPGPVAAGAAFAVSGQVGTLANEVVELLDPAGVVADRAPVTAGRRFQLGSNTRAPGLALFTLRLRDRAGAVVEQVVVPVESLAQPPPRVLVLAGAPDPEIKHLRRWAQDSGIALSAEIALGAGVEVGDAPAPLTPAVLGKLDLVVIDDRRWETLDPGARAALAAAVRGGLGLLLRPTGPLSPTTRRDWAALGPPLSGGETAQPFRLPPASAAATTDDAGEPEAELLPELSRRELQHGGPQAVSILRDGEGAALASWRPLGRGRVGVWTVTDSYALVQTGAADRYAELWSELFSALARPEAGSRPRLDGIARAGARATLCGLSEPASVVGPAGESRALRIDPATGGHACAAYWPGSEGWRLLRDGEGRETPFYVHASDAAASLAAAADRRAILDMTSGPLGRRKAPPPERAPGSPWPWFGLLLSAWTLAWWLERNGRGGRKAAPDPIAGT